MKLETFLSKLEALGVSIDADRRSPELGFRVIMLGAKASFPHPEGHVHLHPLVLRIDQDSLHRDEIEAVQRKLWKGAFDLFEDDPS